MRKITKEMAQAFSNNAPFNKDNTRVQINHYAPCGTLSQIYLHNNLIAEQSDEGLKITNCGWFSNVTKERLNALPNVSICQKKGKWYLNGKDWNGEWLEIKG